MQKEKTNAMIKTVLWILATVVVVILLPLFLIVGAIGLLLMFGINYADMFRWVVDKVRSNASIVRQDKNEQDEELHTEE